MAGAGRDQEFGPGTNWKNGKLYRFHGRGVVVIRPWPKPMAWSRTEGEAWHHTRPRLELGIMELTGPWKQKCWGRQHFERVAWNAIPPEVRDRVLRGHVVRRQWQALSMQARCPGAAELTDSVPLLAAALSCANELRTGTSVARPLRSIRALLRAPDGWKRWQKITGWLFGDSSKALVRIFRRAERRPGEAWQLRSLVELVQVWKDPWGRKLLLHGRRLQEPLIRLLGMVQATGRLSLISPRLVQELEQHDHLIALGARLHIVLTCWDRVWPMRPMPRFESLAQVRARSTELEEILHEKVQVAERRALARPFPPPPLAGLDGISALATTEALKQEAREMSHCLGDRNWERDSRLCRGYGYSLRRGDIRLTIWVVRDRSRSCGFRALTIRGPANFVPGPEQVAWVENWLVLQDLWALHRRGVGALPPGPVLPAPPREWRGPGLLHPEWVEPMLRPVFFEEDIPF